MPSCVDDEHDRRLFADDVAKIEQEILSFNIPRRVVVDFIRAPAPDYISLIHWRWKFLIDGRRSQPWCPNHCVVRHPSKNAAMNATPLEILEADPGDVKVDYGCPRGMPDGFRVYTKQLTMAGCDESQDGSGRAYAQVGRQQFDFESSFEERGPFQRTFAHLHLSPPAPERNLTELFSVTDMVRALLRPPPRRTREGDSPSEEATFIHNNCGHQRGRFVRAIINSNEVGIARYSKCFNNRDGKAYEPKEFYFGDCEGTRDSVKTLLSSLHPFTFSLENTQGQDYITEKRYQALLAGSVPIVWNNHNSLDYLPDPDAAFVVDPSDDPVSIAKKLRIIARNETEYAKFFSWKQRGLRAGTSMQC